MANTNYIVRFNNESSRLKFYEALEKRHDLLRKKVIFGEVMPDLIIYDISNQELTRLRQIAKGEAQFLPDFKHDLFATGQ